MNHSLARDAVKITVSKILALVVSMIIAMLLSRFRSLEEYGTYSQMLTVIAITTSIISLGIPDSINYFLARAETVIERQKFLSVYYSLNTVISIITGLALVLSTSLIVGFFHNPLIKSFIFFLAIFPWTAIIQASIENFLIVYQKTTGIIWFRVSNSILILMIIIAVEVYHWNFQTYVILFLLMQVVFTLGVYFIVARIAGKIQVAFDREIIIKILKFSIPLGLAIVVGTISIQLGNLVIGAIYNTEELAIYANASREMPVTIISASLTAVLLPQLAKLIGKGMYKEAVRLWGKTVVLSYVFISFFASILFIFAPQIITLLYSDKYIAGSAVFRVFSLVILLRTTYFGIILNSMGKTKFILLSSLASLALNLLLSFAFSFAFGIVGAALASLVAIATVNILQLFVTSKFIKISFAYIFPWVEISKITMINILLAVVFGCVKLLVSKTWAINVYLLAVILCIFWLLVYTIIMKNHLMQAINTLRHKES